MARALDFAYLAAVILTLPAWVPRLVRTRGHRTDWAGRLGHGPALPAARHPRVLFHAVSVGEVAALRVLVDELLAGPDHCEVVVAATTDTGFARAEAIFGSTCAVVRYPFDLSSAVERFLDRIRPDAVALVELEIWPNFTAECAARSIPVLVVNGRLTERSARRYDLVRGLVQSSFRRLRVVAAQSEAYAERFRRLGARNVVVTGTMKWDTADIRDEVDGASALAEAMGIDRSRPLVVAGSTALEEHEILERAVPRDVQLLCAPRRPEWFDAAAEHLRGCARRSRGDRGSATGRFLLDTIGELREAYGLADIVVVGRTFARLGGSDMMEPVALGKPTIVGPHISDFQETVEALLERGGIVQTTADGLARAIASLLGDPERAREIARRGREVIREHQGASREHARLIRAALGSAAQSGDARVDTPLALRLRDHVGPKNSPSRQGAETAKEEKEERRKEAR